VAGEGGVIRSGLAEGHSQKDFEEEPVVDLPFPFWIGLNQNA
jgi:hypothetical protein